MNEVLLKRLLGAGVLVIGTLILANLLPEPQVQPPPDESLTRVTYSLKPTAPQPEPIADAPPIAAAPTPEPTPEPEAAPVEIAQAAPPAPKAEPDPKPEPKPETKPETKPEPKPEPPKPVAKKPASKPIAKAPEPQPEPEAQPAKAEAVTPPPAANGAWFVQIGAFALEANATKSVQKLQGAGMTARQDTIMFKAGKRFRVRAGPFASRDEAESQRARAASIGFADARVARE